MGAADSKCKASFQEAYPKENGMQHWPFHVWWESLLLGESNLLKEKVFSFKYLYVCSVVLHFFIPVRRLYLSYNDHLFVHFLFFKRFYIFGGEREREREKEQEPGKDRRDGEGERIWSSLHSLQGQSPT